MKFSLSFLLFMPAFLIGQIMFDNPNYTISAIQNGPEYVRSNVTFTLGQSAYVGLGYTPWTSPTNNKHFYKYNPSNDSWSFSVAVFPGIANMYASAFTLNDKAYVVGGSVSTSSVASSELWAYSNLSNSWTKKADFPGSPRYSAVSFVIGDFAYYGLGSSTTGAKNDFYKYDPITNAWTQISSLGTVGRLWANSFVIGNKAYVVDELIDGPFSIASQVWEYNPDFDSWTQKNDFTSLTQASTLRRGAVAFSNWGRGFYGLGAYESYTERCDLYEYDPIKDKWTTLFMHFDPNSTFDILVNEGAYFVFDNCAYFGLGRQYGSYEDTKMYQMCNGNPTHMNQITSFKKESVISPNPSNGLVTISSPSKLISYEVFEMNGSLIKKSKINSNYTIDLTFLKEGIYLLYLEFESHAIEIQKISILK